MLYLIKYSMKKNNLKKNKENKGFVLLFSVLVASLVLSVGMSIISIALKQVILSGSGRESQYAFYMANTGAECATYWDLAGNTIIDANGNNGPVFAAGASVPATNDLNVKCLGMSITDTTSQQCSQPIVAPENYIPNWCAFSSGSVYNTRFRISYEPTDLTQRCAEVTVSKTVDSNNIVIATKITSRGYNTCDESNPRRIERALEFNY